MPSITTWTRLEPRARHDDMSAFLQARVADPLWNLAVQRRIGEFVGQDAAFPISFDYQVTMHPLVFDSNAADPQLPLDAQAAAETTGLDPAQWAIEQGVAVLQQLLDNAVTGPGIDAIVAAYPFRSSAADIVDPQGSSYLRLLSDRIPSGEELLPVARQAIADGRLPATIGVPAQDVQPVLTAFAGWLDGVHLLVPVGNAESWQPESLHYVFTAPAVSTTGPWARAQTPGWDGDELDWYHFDLVPGDPTDPGYPGTDFPPEGTASGSGIPHPLSIPGAPDPRYWALEDGNVNYANVRVDRSDLARMMLLEFLTVDVADWYLQPIPLPVGAIHTLSLGISNTFGERIPIPMLATSLRQPGQAATGAPDWVMFRPSAASAEPGLRPLDGLLLPSLTTDQLRSSDIESVALVRDDTYDRAWALEQVVDGADARPVDRVSSAPGNDWVEPATPADDDSPVRYLLESPLPEWAFPMVAADVPGLAVQLALPDTSKPPLGVLLQALRGQPVQQQQVPPCQATLLRQRRMARGPDGQLLTWTARQYRLGGSARSPVLDFDTITATNP